MNDLDIQQLPEIQELANLIKSQNEEYDNWGKEMMKKYPYKLTKSGNIKKEYKEEDKIKYDSIYDIANTNAKYKEISKKYKLKIKDIRINIGTLVQKLYKDERLENLRNMKLNDEILG